MGLTNVNQLQKGELYFQGQPVIGEMPVGRKGGFDDGMLTQLVADMGEPRLGYAEFLYLCDRFPEGKMRKMFLMPQGIEDDLAAAPDLLLLFLIDPVGVGYISEVADPKTEYRHLHVPDVDRG